MHKSRMVLLAFGIVLMLSTSGCLAVAAGAGAAGGYTATKYQVSRDVRGSYEKIWDSALTVLKKQGSGVTVDKGIMKAVVEDTEVHIRLKKKNPTYTQIRIRAWKDVRPNENLARRLLEDIQAQM